jgi:hypothetical protein
MSKGGVIGEPLVPYNIDISGAIVFIDYKNLELKGDLANETIGFELKNVIDIELDFSNNMIDISANHFTYKEHIDVGCCDYVRVILASLLYKCCCCCKKV